METDNFKKVPFGLKLICFLFPIVGLIIFLANIDGDKKLAKSCGLSALIGFLITVAILISIVLISGAILLFSNVEIEDKLTKTRMAHNELEEEETKNYYEILENAKSIKEEYNTSIQEENKEDENIETIKIGNDIYDSYEKIKIGDLYSKVIKVIGKETDSTSYTYEWQYGNEKLKISFDKNNEVTTKEIQSTNYDKIKDSKVDLSNAKDLVENKKNGKEYTYEDLVSEFGTKGVEKRKTANSSSVVWVDKDGRYISAFFTNVNELSSIFGML